MPEALPLKFDETMRVDIVFFGIHGVLEEAAKAEAGPEWPEGDFASFSTNKELVRSIPYTFALPQKTKDKATPEVSAETPRRGTDRVEETSVYWFAGKKVKIRGAKENQDKDDEETATNYEIGLRTSMPTTIESIPDHHVGTVFEHFKSEYPDELDGAVDAAGLIFTGSDTIGDDKAVYDLKFMRDTMETIVEADEAPVTTWASLEYEIDEVKMLISVVLRQGYEIGDSEVPISEYDSLEMSSSVQPVHGKKIDGLSKEFLTLPVYNRAASDLTVEDFDPDALLFHIDFSIIARKAFKEYDILAEPMFVHAQNILQMLQRYKQPFLEPDEQEQQDQTTPATE